MTTLQVIPEPSLIELINFIGAEKFQSVLSHEKYMKLDKFMEDYNCDLMIRKTDLTKSPQSSVLCYFIHALEYDQNPKMVYISYITNDLEAYFACPGLSSKKELKALVTEEHYKEFIEEN